MDFFHEGSQCWKTARFKGDLFYDGLIGSRVHFCFNIPKIEIYMEWNQPQKVSEIQLIYDTNFDKSYPYGDYGSVKVKEWPIPAKIPTCLQEMLTFYEIPKMSKRILAIKIQQIYQRFVKIKINA
jgi:hypothetical protein